MDIIESIIQFQPFNEQEETDKKHILALAASQGDVFFGTYDDTRTSLFLRDNALAHFTASAWIVNHERSKVLMVYHNLYDSWSWTGGHADGDRDLLGVAVREAKEETGIEKIRPITEDIFSIEIATVDGHIKKGNYVASHLHLNITYLLEADENQALVHKPDENSGVEWFDLDEAVKASSEPWFRQWIYSKLNLKLRQGYLTK